MSVCVWGGEVMTGRGLCRCVHVEGGGVAVKGLDENSDLMLWSIPHTVLMLQNIPH